MVNIKKYQYEILLSTLIGNKNGILSVAVMQDKLEGSLIIMKNENHFCGTIKPDGSCEISGSIKTLTGSVDYHGDGYIDQQIGAVFIVLLITMKSISLPVILVLSIETAIWLNLSFPYFTDNAIFYIAYLIISSIQLGATVDYAILMTDRYMEYRREMPKKQAVVQTISSCSVSILTSGSALTVVGFLLGFISSHGLLAQLGIFLGRGTLCSLGIVMFVVPGLLYLFDKLIQKTTRNTDFYCER